MLVHKSVFFANISDQTNYLNNGNLMKMQPMNNLTDVVVRDEFMTAKGEI